MDYQYVLIMVRLFSRWVEAFPCWKADTTTAAKKFLENVFSLWGTPNEMSSGRGTHFTGQVIKELNKLIQTLWHYLPVSLGRFNMPVAA